MNPALMVLFLVLLAVHPQTAKPPQAAEVRLDVAAAATSNPAALAISPDGEKIVYGVISEDRFELWIHSLGSGKSRRLPGIDDAAVSFPCWSPDSKSIAFFGRTELRRVEIDTGKIEKLADVSLGRGCSWNHDGVILVGMSNPGRSIYRVAEHGSPLQPATPQTAGNVQSPYFLPDGRHFLYYALGEGIFLAELNGTQPKHLLAADSAAVYAPTGHVLFVRKNTLFAQKFDAGSLTLSGDAFPVAESVPVDAWVPAVSASEAGHLVYRTGKGLGELKGLQWFDRSGKELDNVGESMGLAGSPPILSPDGHTLALQLTVNGGSDVWLFDMQTRKLNQFTKSPGVHTYPIFSADSRTVYFASNQAGLSELYEKLTAGDSPEKLVMPNRGTRLPRDISRDGRFLLFRGASRDIWSIQLDGSPRGEFPVVETPGLDDWPKFSPDGRWIVFQSDESGRNEIYVQPFPSGPRTRVTSNGGVFGFWSAGGKEIVYLGPGNRLTAVPIEITDNDVKLGVPAVLFAPPVINNVADGLSGPPFFVSDDGKRFLVVTISFVRTPIKVIQHWQGRP
jgi:Tol biopolymer transport system component